jgi:hypothetical protein
MTQRWSVQNHIKTVHAIAVCNLVEMSMGLVAEASIPAHLRWLPMGKWGMRSSDQTIAKAS